MFCLLSFVSKFPWRTKTFMSFKHWSGYEKWHPTGMQLSSSLCSFRLGSHQIWWPTELGGYTSTIPRRTRENALSPYRPYHYVDFGWTTPHPNRRSALQPLVWTNPYGVSIKIHYFFAISGHSYQCNIPGCTCIEWDTSHYWRRSCMIL